jgi:hypothetical protein
MPSMRPEENCTLISIDEYNELFQPDLCLHPHEFAQSAQLIGERCGRHRPDDACDLQRV